MKPGKGPRQFWRVPQFSGEGAIEGKILCAPLTTEPIRHHDSVEAISASEDLRVRRDRGYAPALPVA